MGVVRVSDPPPIGEDRSGAAYDPSVGGENYRSATSAFRWSYVPATSDRAGSFTGTCSAQGTLRLLVKYLHDARRSVKSTATRVGWFCLTSERGSPEARAEASGRSWNRYFPVRETSPVHVARPTAASSTRDKPLEAPGDKAEGMDPGELPQSDGGPVWPVRPRIPLPSVGNRPPAEIRD